MPSRPSDRQPGSSLSFLTIVRQKRPKVYKMAPHGEPFIFISFLILLYNRVSFKQFPILKKTMKIKPGTVLPAGKSGMWIFTIMIDEIQFNCQEIFDSPVTAKKEMRNFIERMKKNL